MWGGNGFAFFDCSGLVRRSINDYYYRYESHNKPLPDMTAQDLYHWQLKTGSQCTPPEPGCLLYYGESTDKIKHVAIMGEQGMLIESGGAGRETEKMPLDELLMYCSEKDARVREMRFGHRNDLVASIKFNTENLK